MEEKPTWEEILKLLGMTNASFRDQKEMDLGYDYMWGLIKKFGREWLKENRYYAMNNWEEHKERYRQEIYKQKQKKKRKGLLSFR
jgi:hypothetical protein